MSRVIGPTVPRWRLGEQLSQLRQAHEITVQTVAEHLRCSVGKVRAIEQGVTSVNRSELTALLDLYAVTDEHQRDYLDDLQRLGRQRGWWSKYNKHISPTLGTFLGLESAATHIDAWAPIYLPGLLQTEAYVRATTTAEGFTEEQVQRVLELRRTRQEQVWDNEPPEAWFIIDESVLQRPIGGRPAMAEQLRHLVDMSDRCTLQVLPLARGEHPGMLGSLVVFEFEADLHSPVAYVETFAGNLYLEGDDLARCRLAMTRLQAYAASPPESLAMIRSALEDYEP